MKYYLFILFMVMNFLLLSACGSSDPENVTNNTGREVNFGNPVEVTIVGYSGDAQEPYISGDGSILFFNNLNSNVLLNGNENDTNIHYARRISDTTFQYIGEVRGANTDEVPGVNELEAVASIDKNNKFYFVNTTDYLNSNSQNYLVSLFEADYVNGDLVNIKSIPNLKSDRPPRQSPLPGELNFDAEIHRDGDVLYFVEGIFSGNPFPDEADISIARKVNGVFVVDQNSDALFNSINTENLEYAPSISTDQLELYFSRAIGSVASGYDFGIYVATRNSVSEAWRNPKRLEVTNGEFSEGPSISFDGRLLYYHQKVLGAFKIYVVERK